MIQWTCGCFTSFYISRIKGGRGWNWSGAVFSRRNPGSDRIRKTLPLMPNRKPNTKRSRNLKISGLMALSKRWTYMPILLKAVNLKFSLKIRWLALLSLDMNHGYTVLQSSQQKADALCNFTLISWDMEAERISSHDAKLYNVSILWGKSILLPISFSVDTRQV